jgi:glutaredoxin-like protein
MAALLSEEDRKYLVDLFEKELKGEVKILFFGSKKKEECEYCDLTEQILQELAETSNKITIESHDFDDEEALAKKYNVEMVPAILMLDSADKDMRIRYYGIPSGYEFSSLIEDVIATSKNGTVELSPDTIKKLENIKEPLKLQVFVTPTCPYCPKAVLMAHKLAMQSPKITGEMIEANEFPDLSLQSTFYTFPHIIINEGEGEFVGALPEEAFVEQVINALKGV